MRNPRSVLITGASSGIGRALALHYATVPDIRLALVGRNAERLHDTATQARAQGAEVDATCLDVRDRESLQAWIAGCDDTRPVDLVIPNAGITSGLAATGLRETSEARAAVLATNVTGVLNTIEPLIDRMAARGAGQIAFIGSMAAYRGFPYAPSYCASKAAIHRYAEALRPLLRPHGVHVSLVVPGIITTALIAGIKAPPIGQMSAADAGRIIRRGLAARHDVIAFPRSLYYAARFVSSLPHRLTDPILRRLQIQIPEHLPEDR